MMVGALYHYTREGYNISAHSDSILSSLFAPPPPFRKFEVGFQVKTTLQFRPFTRLRIGYIDREEWQYRRMV